MRVGVMDGTSVSVLVGLKEGVGVSVGTGVGACVGLEVGVGVLVKAGVGVRINWISRAGKLQLRRRKEVINRARGTNAVFEYLDLGLCIIHR